MDIKKVTFKEKCKEMGVDYWRALKRHEAGLSDEKVFSEDYIRHSRKTEEITVFGTTYPNIKEAIRVLSPPASAKTIRRWIKSGRPPEEAFEHIPNPGYANGIIYLITHKESGKQYIGLTIQTLERRWIYHNEQARAGYIKGQLSLHAALREHGSDAFEIQQIDGGMTKRDLERKEREWIEKLGTLAPNGYNISAGGVSGGSSKKPVIVDGIRFVSVGEASRYVAKTRSISLHAATYRLRKNRVDSKTPAKPGESLVKTPAYKAWSRIVHQAVNPKSKDYISGVALYAPWREFSVFYQDVGQPPGKGMAFARIDKTKGFYPGNCVWMSKSEASKINAAYMKKSGTLTKKKPSKKILHAVLVD